MTQKEFNSLSSEKKQELLWEWGYYLTMRKQENYNIVIFSFGNFFAQALYKMPENTLESIVGLTSDELDPELFLSIGINNPFIKLARRSETGSFFLNNLKKKNSISDNILKNDQ